MEQLVGIVDRNFEIPGIFDAVTLQAEVDQMRGELDAINNQMAMERDLATKIHSARHAAVEQSPALRLVFNFDDHSKKAADLKTTDMLRSAFMTESSDSRVVPEGYSDSVARALRVEVHPDAGGDIVTAQQVAEALEDIEKDETFAVVNAILRAPKLATDDLARLRNERYRLTIALGSVAPNFTNPDEAAAFAKAEIDGAEWRMRTIAAFKSFELIIGSGEKWQDFLQDIVRGQRMSLIEMVNRVMPEMRSLQERIVKGDPREMNKQDMALVDEVFERIWSTLKKKPGDPLPYSPPYQNWLEILLPAMRKLDPGKKPGEDYTYFEPPIRVTRQAPRPSRPISDYSDESYIAKDKKKSSIIYENYNNNEY